MATTEKKIHPKKQAEPKIENRILGEGMVLVRARGHMYEGNLHRNPGDVFEVDEERSAAIAGLVEVVKTDE